MSNTFIEKEKVFYGLDEVSVFIPKEISIHERFEQQVKKYPHRVAVIIDNQKITYTELNEKANKLARYLQKQGVNTESYVGIYIDRSIEMIISILGILKTGGAYVPIETIYPKDRVDFILHNANISVLLSRENMLNNLPIYEGKIICLDLDYNNIDSESSENLLKTSSPDNTAYIIYTSGSTGTPKGVMVTHYNVIRLFMATDHWFHFNEYDIWTMFHSYAFDFSVWEIWGALLYGGKLVIVPYLVSRSPEQFYELMIKEKVTVLNQTPSAFYQFIDADMMYNGMKENIFIRYIIFGGEKLNIQNLKSWFDKHGDKKPQLINMYGITETTVHVTYRPLTINDIENYQGSVIGESIPDLRLYLLDKNLKLVNIGEIGEIHVGGAGLSNGYLGKPELTSERFIQNPFIDSINEKLYKSGDYGRLLSGGDIEYIGRMDNQVKIRGHRIELGEIESVLIDHPAVNKCAIVPWDKNEDTNLIAYIVPEYKNAYTIRQIVALERDNKLLKLLKIQLPNDMVVITRNKNETEFMYNEIFNNNSYFKHGITINDGDCILDIGANIGMFPMFLFTLKKDITIFAFEPIPPIYEILKYNSMLYDLKIKTFNYGIGDKSQIVTFGYYPFISVLSGRYVGTEERETVRNFLLTQQEFENSCVKLSNQQINELLEERMTIEQFDCPIKTLSQVIKENDIKKIDLLKIDVEKSEFEVLQGINSKDWEKIKQIVIEVHDTDKNLKKIIEILMGHGFNVSYEKDTLLQNTPLYNVYAKRESSEILLPSQKGITDKNLNYEEQYYSEEKFLNSIRNYLKDKLPAYMIPSYFVLIDKMPLNHNNKLDIPSLPKPEFSNDLLYVAPRNAIEEKLVAIWEELLNIKKIGIRDNFLHIGGHSLLAVRLIVQVRQQFNKKISLHQILEGITIEELAKLIDN